MATVITQPGRSCVAAPCLRSIATPTQRVLAAASTIEPDLARRLAWYAEDPIHQFGGRTADQMVRAGETSRLIVMIHGIRAMEEKP